MNRIGEAPGLTLHELRRGGVAYKGAAAGPVAARNGEALGLR